MTSQPDVTTPPPDILSADFVADPYPFHATLRDDYPALWHAPTQSWLISRFADVAAAFKSPAYSSHNYDWQLEPIHGRTILQMDGTEHSTHRALLNPFFRGKGLERFHGWYHSIMAHLNNLAGDPAVTAAADQTRADLQEYMLPIIRERRTGDGEDLLSRLCRAEVDGQRMSDEEIKAFVSLLLVAGGETTDKAIASMIANLLAHPEQLEAVRADRSLVDAVIAETLRHSGPVHMIMRQTKAPVDVDGTTVPAGATCILMLAAANRDERAFADPDVFDIFRADLDVARAFSGAANHVQFILGRHFCVGSLLARAEMTVALNLVLDTMPGLRLSPGYHPQEAGLYTRGVPSLLVEFDPT